jgi:DNA-binding transcriptional regulator LsrR (DeoR family)
MSDQLETRVAWLYYMEGLTQATIADQLGLTRLRVNRLLTESRQSGLVQVTINSPFTDCVALEQRLKGEHGLKDAVIVPTPADAALIPALLGAAAGQALTRILSEQAPAMIGVGWGRTLRETIRHVRPLPLPDAWVTALMGGLTVGSELNTFEITNDLARQLQARCCYLAAPVYAGSPESRDTIVAQDVFRDAFARMATVEVALLSLGDTSEQSLLVRHGLPSDIAIADLVAAGAVGDILGQFLTREGRPIDHPLNRRVIGIDLEQLAGIGTVVVAAGGANKAGVIAAALAGGLIDVLVSDENTVRAALSA